MVAVLGALSLFLLFRERRPVGCSAPAEQGRSLGALGKLPVYVLPAEWILSRPRRFEEEPDAPFRFVDPILQQACRSDVVFFAAQLVSFAHTGKQRPVVFA